MKHQRSQPDDLTIERLMKARMAIAYAMTLDGSVYGPVFERLEAEIAGRRAAEDVMARAQACLVDYASVASPVVGVKAIN